MMDNIFSKILEKCKLIPKKTLENQPCYDKYGRFLGWFSRSMAVAVFMYCRDKDGDWCVLASERGKGVPDFKGHWNCVCGYVERDTTIAENCIKEVHEEVGLDIKEGDLILMGFEDTPSANRQNVTFRYAVVYNDRVTDDFTFSHEWNEKDEVGEIKWIKIKDIGYYPWAFNHNKRIIEIFEQLRLQTLKKKKKVSKKVVK